MIELRKFSMGFGQRDLLKDVNATFADGKLTALIGRNGTGKSTLLRAMAGLNGNYSGEIRINGETPYKSAAGLAKNLAFVSTGLIRIPNMRCRDVVAAGRAPYTNWIGKLSEGDCEIVMQSLESVGMSEFADRSMDKMSDGECQRVMIARALAQSTPVILLDEPTSFLDLPNRYELCMLLSTLSHRHNKSIVFSTHELDIAMSLCDSIALIDTPQLHLCSTDEMRRNGYIERLFKIPASRV